MFPLLELCEGDTACSVRHDLQGGQAGGKEGKQEKDNYIKFVSNVMVSGSFLPSREPAGKCAAPLLCAQERGQTVTL